MPQSKRWLPALDGQPGPAPSISEARSKAMVDAALEGAFAPPARARVRMLTKVTFAMAATLVALAAAAGTLAWRHEHARSPAAPLPASSQTGPAASASPVEIPPPAAPAPTAIEGPSPPSSVSAPLRATEKRDASRGELSDLLARANDLRAARRWRDAMLAYERVVSARPSSPEAYAARVAAADLRLEQLGDPAGALRLYRAARAGRGGDGRLDEQVLWGIARGTRGLGDSRAEDAALRDYVSRYPGGLFAPDARRRIPEIGPRP